ncbi:hypothetical protein [Streptomyces marincola]|uniref:Uncharacterized protein n=1 Tax=Streptomyces marincola TaxID=2878388 RepID=A0A1W7D254_9ACTN|nr:hypothetical protein [Streptomyces marincola]ARQ71104.1 hypothetical protein CAG99_21810 [Streptomyces marincola]UCM87541.1 hypothetical protein LC193_06035 [Streptomyces marincola]
MRGVLVSVEIDAATVRAGDQVVIGGQPFTVRDMTALGSGRKRLEFETGETLVMNRRTVLWAARRHDPRIPRGRPA